MSHFVSLLYLQVPIKLEKMRNMLFFELHVRNSKANQSVMEVTESLEVLFLQLDFVRK